MKTVQEYMNDPRITDDPGLVDAPESVREVHAIRLMLQERRANMPHKGLVFQLFVPVVSS